MDASLESLVGLYRFSPGRRLFALEQVHKIASARNEIDLLPSIDEAMTAERKHIELIAAYQRGRDQAKGSPATQEIDWSVDRTLGSLQEMALAITKVLERGDALGPRIETMLQAMFPAGLTAVTLLPYVEELAQIDRILKVAAGHRETITAIGAERVVARLATLAQELRAALETRPEQLVSYDVVRAASMNCQNLLLQVTVAILGKYRSNELAHAQGRATLLQPILVQNDAIGQYLRARRSVPDVDPATGNELPGSAPVVPPPA